MEAKIVRELFKRKNKICFMSFPCYVYICFMSFLYCIYICFIFLHLACNVTLASYHNQFTKSISAVNKKMQTHALTFDKHLVEFPRFLLNSFQRLNLIFFIKIHKIAKFSCFGDVLNKRLFIV